MNEKTVTKEVNAFMPENLLESVCVKIEGTSDLVLNKMNARNTRALLATDRKKIREVPNKWEDIITAIHWRDPILVEDTYKECTEELFYEMLKTNAPCITAFGLKKSFCDAVVRNEIDKYSTKISNAINVSSVDGKGYIPVAFTHYNYDERLMSPKKGAPVSVCLSHFSGWSATFRIDYTEHVYSLGQILGIVNLAGFGLGIGSGRSSGYGRYKIGDIESLF